MKTIKSQKVLIVDDHPLTREGIRTILENEKNIQIVGEANDGLEAVSLVIEKKPDLVIMDITMPHMSGIDATKEILAEYPKTKIVALSIHSGERYVKEMLAAGAVGYLLKESAPEELVTAFKKVIKGDIYLSSRITRTALSKNKTMGSSDSFRILRTKLLRPPVGSEYIVREKIIDELEQNIVKPLTLVSAGAGYGKSVTISQWLAHSQRRHAWISLDEEHNDLRTFLQYLHEAIVLVIPGSMTETGKAINVVELPPLNQLIHILLNDLFDIEDELIFVLDDFHNIKNEEIHQLFDEWLSFPPPNIHLCIITRRDPPLKINLLQLQGRITEIRMNKLSFVCDEIVNLFKQQLGIDFDDNSIHTLHEKTEGWIIGLRLATMLIKNQEDVNKVLKTFEGGLVTLSDFLISEVLAKLPPALKNQLLITSVLNRFCNELIDEIFDVLGPDAKDLEATSSGRKFIQWLIKSNMFVINLDNEHLWFRFHHLFRDFLRDQLKKRRTEEEISKLYLAASLWFKKSEFLEEAIKYALLAADIEGALSIISENWEEYFEKEKWFVVERWIGMFPDEIVENSVELLSVRFWIANRKNFTDDILEIKDKLELSSADLKDSDKGYLALAKCMVSYKNDSAKNVLAFAEEAFRRIPERCVTLRTDAECWWLFAMILTGKGESAVQTFSNKLAQLNPVDDIVQISRYFVYYGYYALLDANIPKLKEATFEIFKLNNVSEYMLMNGVYFKACIYWWANDHHGVIHHLKNAWKITNHLDAYVTIENNICMALSYQELGNKEEALRAMDNAVLSAKNSKQTGRLAMALSGQARLALMQGNLQQAEDWLYSTEHQDLDRYGLWFIEDPAITRCRILLARESSSRVNEALMLLEKYQVFYEVNFNTLRLLEVLALKIEAYIKLGQSEKAHETLVNALNVAYPGQWIKPFAEMNYGALDLLYRVRESHGQEEKYSVFLNKIIDAIAGEKPDKGSNSKILEDKKNADVISLTQSELKVLKLVAKGYRNKEIADSLYNSEETIKKHIYNMFQKLDVKNRLNLVNRAKELGIIES